MFCVIPGLADWVQRKLTAPRGGPVEADTLVGAAGGVTTAVALTSGESALSPPASGPALYAAETT